MNTPTPAPRTQAAWYESRHGENPNALYQLSEELERETAALREALAEVMTWVDNWSPDFTMDDEWDATELKAKAVLTYPQPIKGE